MGNIACRYRYGGRCLVVQVSNHAKYRDEKFAYEDES
jgi:hypothetical protein